MKLLKPSILPTVIGLAVCGVAAPRVALAQLEEITVTAQKREQSMQDVPIAVSAVTGEKFEATHAFTLEGLSATLPNVQIGHFANTPHNAVFNIRGIGAPIEPDPYAGTTVSVVVDGVPQFFNMMALLDLFDVERVEVLKGPQGTLFGANTTGGVVSVVTRQPTGEYGGRATVTAGSYNRLDGSFVVDFPIIKDELAGKLAMTHHGQDGYYTNIVTGESAGDVDTTGARAYLRYTGADDFDAILSYEYVRSRNGAPAIVNGSSPNEVLSEEAMGYTRGEVFGDNAKAMYETPCPIQDQRCKAPDKYYTANSQVPDQSNFTSNFAILTMNWDTQAGAFTSITAYKDFELDEYTDQDFSPVFGSATHRPTDGWQFSQELRGSFQLNDRFLLQAGGFYMKSSYNHLQNYMQDQFATGYREETYNFGENWSGSLFAQGYYDITDKLRFQAGIRYSHEEAELQVILNSFINLDADGVPVQNRPTGFSGDVALGTITDVTGSEEWDEIGGKLGLDYKLNNDSMLYGTYTRGFKSGGFVGRIRQPPEIGPFDPEYVDAFELGVKSELFNNTVRINTAVFLNQYTDQQISSIRREEVDGLNVNVNTILNAAESEIYGFEAEIEAAPTDGLTINASLAYLQAEYQDFLYVDAVGTEHDLSGEPLQNAPEWGASLSATYEFSLGPGRMAANLSYRYSDTKYYTNILNTPRSEIQATHFVDASLDWTPDDGRWSVSIWGRNLADKRYISVAFDNPGYGALVGYHPPREAGVTFNYNFD